MGKRRAKSLKEISFKIEDYVTVGEIEIPIVSRSVKETTAILGCIRQLKVPKKTRFATMEEADEAKKRDPSLKGIPMIVEYDETHADYVSKNIEASGVHRVLEIIGQYIDMDCETDTGDVWSDWEIKKGDWYGVGLYIMDNFSQKEIDSLEIGIKGKMGNRTYVLLQKLEEMSGKSVIEILQMINRIDDMDKVERELAEKGQALQEMQDNIYDLLAEYNFDEDGSLVDIDEVPTEYTDEDVTIDVVDEDIADKNTEEVLEADAVEKIED